MWTLVTLIKASHRRYLCNTDKSHQDRVTNYVVPRKCGSEIVFGCSDHTSTKFASQSKYAWVLHSCTL